MKYWVILTAKLDDGVVLTSVPEDGPDDFEYDEGAPLLKGYPDRDEAVMVYDTDYPEGVKLYDILSSLDGIIVVSIKVKTIFDELGIDDVEYLPISLWDHQQKPVNADYYILNPVGSVEFIDMDNSEYRMDPLDEEQIGRIKKLVVNVDKIPKGANLFRAKTKTDQIFINSKVRGALKKAGVKGYKLFEAEGWDGLPI